jgi:glycosidase
LSRIGAAGVADFIPEAFAGVRTKMYYADLGSTYNKRVSITEFIDLRQHGSLTQEVYMAVSHTLTDLDFRPASPLHPSPEDWRDQFLYFLLVDRFDSGAEGIPPYIPGGAAAAADPATRGRFQGGTLKGVIRRLDYIRDLGCTAIWLSPIFKNRQDKHDSYHGYGIQNFLDVDPRYGTLADLQELTREAHKRGMYVVLDVVFNHTGDVWAYPGDHPYYYWQGQRFPFGYWRESDAAEGLQGEDAVWPLELQFRDAFKRRGQIRNWHDEVEARDGDFLTLKELDIPRPEVLDALIKIYKYWICVADVDGFRIDTVKHMEYSAVAIFCNAIREYAHCVGKHRFFLYGEIVDDDETIQRYIGRNSRINGTEERFPALDAALDFPLYFMLEEVIKGFGHPAWLRDRYSAFHRQYSDHGDASRYFVTFVDNHDQMARPYRRFMHGNPYPQQAVLAMGYLLTTQGIPCIYYGTEQGFDGGGSDDAYVRECMFGGSWGGFGTAGCHFFDPQHEIYGAIAEIANLRQEEPALRFGRLYFREISGDGVSFGHPMGGDCTLAYSRILDTREALVALNLSNHHRNDCITVDRNLSAPGQTLRDRLDPARQAEVQQAPDGRAYVRVELPPFGMAVMM